MASRLNTPKRRNISRRDRTAQWAAYVAGVFLVLMRELGVRFDREHVCSFHRACLKEKASVLRPRSK